MDDLLEMYRDAVEWERARFEPQSSHDWGVCQRLYEVLAEDAALT